MAYDAVRQRTVLFGGLGSGPLGDTWEWDGIDWTLRNPGGTSPSPRVLHAMAYDPVRQRVVLFGGLDSSNPRLADTWEWDGAQWTQLLTETSPPGRKDHGLAYDGARQRLVLLGGSGSDLVDLQATWILGATERASTEVYRTGCPGSHGVPSLQGFGRPVLGNPSFAFDLGSVRPGAPVVLAVSTGSANQQFGPCTLLVDLSPAVALAGVSDDFGFTSFPVPVPVSPDLIGVEFYAQGVAMDPAGSYASLSASNGLLVRVGN